MGCKKCTVKDSPLYNKQTASSNSQIFTSKKSSLIDRYGNAKANSRMSVLGHRGKK